MAMTVYRKRRILQKVLADALPGFFIAVNSDHPLLMRSADLLVARSGNIDAIFLPTQKEALYPHHLKSRISLNRLALPPHTRFFLVTEKSSEHLAEQFQHDFAHTLPSNAIKELPMLVKDIEFQGNHQDVPRELIHRSQDIFISALNASKAAIREIGLDARSDQVSSRVMWRENRKSERSLVEEFRADRMHAPQVDVSEFQLGRALIASLIDAQAERRFVLDRGVPYEAGIPISVAIVDDYVGYSRGSSKVIIASAFSGIALVPANNRRRADSLKMTLEKRVKESPKIHE